MNFSDKPQPDYDRMQRDLEESIRRAFLANKKGIGAKDIAWRLSGGHNVDKVMNRLYRRVNCDNGEAAIYVTELLRFCAAAEDFGPIITLARQAGLVVFDAPALASLPDGEVGKLLEALTQAIKEFGEFAAEAAKDIADGRIPHDQLTRIEREGFESMEKIAVLIHLARELNRRQYGGRLK